MSVDSRSWPDLLASISSHWPALIAIWVVFLGLRYIFRRLGHAPKIAAVDRSLQEIMTSLACSEAQAKRLLAAYAGNSAKAIQEVKTGRSVIPGEEYSSVATFCGELTSYTVSDGVIRFDSKEGEKRAFPVDQRALITFGVVEPQQRPDSEGLAKADRGATFAQFYIRYDDGWFRYLLNSSRMDYVHLGERKENSAIRNFRLVIGDLVGSLPGLEVDRSWQTLQEDLKAPHYKSLADFEGAAVQKLVE